jgi:hypothetical protein
MPTPAITNLLSEATPITGNTYPVKDQLKAAGCRWDQAQRCWMAGTAEIAAKAAKIMGRQPSPSAQPASGPTTPRPTMVPVWHQWRDKKYQVRPQPVSKYAPFFGADTLPEIVAWLDSDPSCSWRFRGTSGDFQGRQSRGMDIAVCILGRTMDGSGEHTVMRWMPCPESDAICHRDTPGRGPIGMGSS